MPVNLMIHCGASLVDKSQLSDTPLPDRTETWVPIPHDRLLDGVSSTLQTSGLTIVNEAHALSRDGQRYFGLMEVRNGHQRDDYALIVGLRNSHDKSFPASLAVGSGVFVCDNLAFSGEVVLARKHTAYIERDLPQLIQRSVGELGTLQQDQDQRIEAYKDKRLSDRQAHHLLIQTIDARVLPVTRLPEALREWRVPSHESFEEGGKNAWRLFNACTEVIKGRSLESLPRRTQALHGILDHACRVSLN